MKAPEETRVCGFLTDWKPSQGFPNFPEKGKPGKGTFLNPKTPKRFTSRECIMKIFKTFVSLAAVAILMAGCAFTPVQPGMSREQVMASYGTPTRALPLATGTRLQYSRQPAGQSAVMVDLDAAGKVVAVREVMKRQEFLRIEPGKWTRDDVEREFGPPARVDRVASWSGDIMNYRWRDSLQDMLFWVYLDAANRVQRTGQGIELPVETLD